MKLILMASVNLALYDHTVSNYNCNSLCYFDVKQLNCKVQGSNPND